MPSTSLSPAILPLLAQEPVSASGSIPWLWIIIGAVVLIVAVIGIIAYRAGGEMSEPIRLVVTSGVHSGSEFAIRSAFATIGTEKDNDVVVNDDKVSKHHARCHFRKGTLTIADTNSLYGTFLNDERIEEASCSDGDVIRLGTEFECRVVLPAR